MANRRRRAETTRPLALREREVTERYTVYRNKFPRPAGQGASLIERLFTGISGSQTGAQGVLDVAIPELVATGGSFSTWPLNLPPAGSQTEVLAATRGWDLPCSGNPTILRGIPSVSDAAGV
jgi:hypothetical protein